MCHEVLGRKVWLEDYNGRAGGRDEGNGERIEGNRRMVEGDRRRDEGDRRRDKGDRGRSRGTEGGTTVREMFRKRYEDGNPLGTGVRRMWKQEGGGKRGQDQ